MSSPPPEIILASNGNSNGSLPPPVQPSRKRKRGPVAASSPAPSDSASTPAAPTSNAPTNDSLVTRGDLSSRPILSISRGPIFMPCDTITSTATNVTAEYFKTDLIAVNRIGFRYVPAGINPPGHATPCRTIESNPTSYRVSWEDRSPFIRVTKDGLGLAGSSGFRSARCNAPIREGKWYLEVTILNGGGDRLQQNGLGVDEGGKTRKEGAYVRLGWGRREATLNGPVGLDGYSYGYRDKTGEKVTLSRPRPYGKPYASGDVVGMYISLPPRRVANPKDAQDPAHIRRERIPIDLKGQEVFEILEYPQCKEMSTLMDYSGKSTQSSSVPSSASKKSGPNAGKPPETTTKSSPAKPQPHLRPLPTLGPESKIAFFVNGECQGIGFQDLYDYLQLRQPKDKTQRAKERKRAKEGVKEHRENPFDDGWLGYYPFISLFNDASVSINPGPEFEYPPPPDIDALLEGRDPLVPPVLNPEPNLVTSGGNRSGMDTDLDMDVKPTRTWRPACERYAEFMREQWDLDEIEEEEARGELTRWQENNKREEEKAEQRKKKRREADAKRKAKKAAEADAKKREVSLLKEDLEREKTGAAPMSNPVGGPLMLGIGLGGATSHTSSSYPSPSPLRFSTAAYDLDKEIEAAALESERSSIVPRGRSTTSEPQERSPPEEGEMVIDQETNRGHEWKEGEKEGESGVGTKVSEGHSPAPTAGSYVGPGGSEYASDFQEDVEREPEGSTVGYGEPEEVEEEEEGEIEDRRVKPKIEYVREEEEEEEEG